METLRLNPKTDLMMLRTTKKRRSTVESLVEGTADYLVKNDRFFIQLLSFSENKMVKKIRKKDLLFMEGDSANFLYIIESGKIKVFKSNEFGKEYIIDIYKTGDFIGYASLMKSCSQEESAIAIENSKITLIPKDDFLKLLYNNKEVCSVFIRLMSTNYFEMEKRLLNLAYDSARKRVAEALLFVSKKYQKDDKHESPFSMERENISAIAGISRESVSRTLTYFKKEGLIVGNNNDIQILDYKKLERMKN